MRVFLAALVCVGFAASPAAASGTWKITKDHWDASDEEGFGKFVAGFGESDCKDPASCFKSAANPYRDTDPPELKMDGDCADFVYQLRAVGYDGTLNIEHEDALVNSLEGVGRAARLLKQVALVEAPDWKPADI